MSRRRGWGWATFLSFESLFVSLVWTFLIFSLELIKYFDNLCNMVISGNNFWFAKEHLARRKKLTTIRNLLNRLFPLKIKVDILLVSIFWFPILEFRGGDYQEIKFNVWRKDFHFRFVSFGSNVKVESTVPFASYALIYLNGM